MKKSFLLFIAALSSVCSFAQHRSAVQAHTVQAIGETTHHGLVTGRTTSIGDTIVLSNITTSDTLTTYTYSADSGYVAGTNAFGDMGFAERYDFNGADSSIRVIGVMSRFAGVVNPASTNSVNFHVWSIGVPVPISSTLSYSGFPNMASDTLNVPFTQLGISSASDTLKAFFFDSATATFNQSFFVGYDVSYNFTTLAGDTIGLISSKNGERNTPSYYAYLYVNDFGDTTRDTTIFVQNATLWSDNTWHDNFTDNDGLFNNLSIFPIVAVNAPTGIDGITHNNLTFFGNYPNPSATSTNIRFSLLKGADVTIDIMDMSGRSLQSTHYKSMGNGEHIINVSVDQLSSGNYLYSIRTSTGEAIASKLTVIK